MTDPRTPFFTFGVPRSGITLLSLMLDAQRRIAFLHESQFIMQYALKEDHLAPTHATAGGRKKLVEHILAEPYVSRWDWVPSLGDIDPSDCTSPAITIGAVFGSHAKHFQKDIWGGKTPSYTRIIDALNRMFRSCKFIHILRDGRNAALSVTKQSFDLKELLSALAWWNAELRSETRMPAMLPARGYFELSLKDLVSDPKKHLVMLTDLLEIAFDPVMITEFGINAKKGWRLHTQPKRRINFTAAPYLNNPMASGNTKDQSDYTIGYGLRNASPIQISGRKSSARRQDIPNSYPWCERGE